MAQEQSESINEGRIGAMHKRPTRMSDGRYLIYYTFGENNNASHSTGNDAQLNQLKPKAEAVEEERRV